ncbi:MAG: acyl-CoA dehydrogenase family protein [Acidimicrobiia bacterium]|nr:acyl-CoA dehydrogenase family protein [Acidimicrobiia bacterium]
MSTPADDPIDPAAFRRDVRAFFERTGPAALAQAVAGPAGAGAAAGHGDGAGQGDGDEGVTLTRAKAWRAALYDAGLGGLDYPRRFGGRGSDDTARAIFAEESRGRIPREDAVFAIGVGMALPTIRDHAGDHLREALLRPGLRGEHVWCQLYSEPGAGSDLASLATRAELDGDEWVVHGQKVWTSGAHHSDLAILLARTNPAAPKHRGITMLVLPMRQAGVEVRPLRQMTGVAEFNEVFLDGARTPRDWVIGEVDDGWRMAVALLAHERRTTGVASMGGSGAQRSKSGRLPIPYSQLAELAATTGRSREPLVRQELAALHAGEVVVRQLARSAAHPSVGKLWRTRQGRRAADLAAALAFPSAPAWSSDDAELDYWQFHVLNCRAMSIGGGTDEIQRNTLGERALGLPREPAPG